MSDFFWEPTSILWTDASKGKGILVSSAAYLHNAEDYELVGLTRKDGSSKYKYTKSIQEISNTLAICGSARSRRENREEYWNIDNLEWKIVKKKSDGIRARKQCSLAIWKPSTVRDWVIPVAERRTYSNRTPISWKEVFSEMWFKELHPIKTAVSATVIHSNDDYRAENIQLFVHILSKIVNHSGFLFYWVLLALQGEFKAENLGTRKLNWIGAILDMIIFEKFPLKKMHNSNLGNPTDFGMPEKNLLDFKTAEELDTGDGEVWFDLLTTFFDPKVGIYHTRG